LGAFSIQFRELALIREWVPSTLTPEQLAEALAPVSDQIKAAHMEGMAMGIAVKALAGQAVDGDDVKSAIATLRQ
jgi:hypothetical protein